MSSDFDFRLSGIDPVRLQWPGTPIRMLLIRGDVVKDEAVLRTVVRRRSPIDAEKNRASHPSRWLQAMGARSPIPSSHRVFDTGQAHRVWPAAEFALDRQVTR